MKINFTLKLLVTSCMLLFSSLVFAQDQTITMGDNTDYNYSVDTDPANGGALPYGTQGSTYAWSISGGGTFPTTGTYNADLTDNKATINWSTAAPGDYTVTVVESNGSCPTDTSESFVVRVVAPNASGDVNWTDTNICQGGDVTFEVTGAIPNSTLYYSVNNATITTGTVLIDSSGNATITVVHDGSNNNTVVITLDKLVLNGTDINYTDPKPTVTANINIIQTSPIQIIP